jgi:hypothetical protein
MYAFDKGNHIKKSLLAFMLILVTGFAIHAQTSYEIDLESVYAPARCYFEATGKSDLKTLRACFHKDAVINDVSRKIAGIDAISDWARAEVFGGRYTVHKIVSKQKDALKLLISFAPPGFAEGSQGFKAHYSFDFKDGKIFKMDLQYA